MPPTSPDSCLRKPLTLSQIRKIFLETYCDLQPDLTCPTIHLEFYRFVGINHTIRLKDGKLFVRLSDLFKQVSTPVLRALAIILLSKLFHIRIPPLIRKTYQEYANSPELKRRAQSSRKHRGHKLMSNPAGNYYDLVAIFSRLNRDYFGGRLQQINLGWSLKRSRKILGHFDPSHRSITISRLLDDSKVPKVVIGFILFHEMLHAKLMDHPHCNIKNPHSQQFQKEERRFYGYRDALNWIQEHS